MGVTESHLFRCEESGEPPRHPSKKSGSLLLVPPPGVDLGVCPGDPDFTRAAEGLLKDTAIFPTKHGLAGGAPLFSQPGT